MIWTLIYTVWISIDWRHYAICWVSFTNTDFYWKLQLYYLWIWKTNQIIIRLFTVDGFTKINVFFCDSIAFSPLKIFGELFVHLSDYNDNANLEMLRSNLIKPKRIQAHQSKYSKYAGSDMQTLLIIQVKVQIPIQKIFELKLKKCIFYLLISKEHQNEKMLQIGSRMTLHNKVLNSQGIYCLTKLLVTNMKLKLRLNSRILAAYYYQEF